MKFPRPTNRECYELLAVAPLTLAAATLLPVYRAIPAAVGLPLLWLWFCSARRKWQAEPAPKTVFDVADIRRRRLAREWQVACGGSVLSALTFGMPWGVPMGSCLILGGCVVWWMHTQRDTMAEMDRVQAADQVILPGSPAERVDEVRPRLGSITRGDTGQVIDVRWVPADDEPNVFVPVDLDGQPVYAALDRRDVIEADVVGPGQALRFYVDHSREDR